jgi:ATP-binding cassette subfamily C exporter for protease/lipase
MVSSDHIAAPQGAAVPLLRELPSGAVFSALLRHRRAIASALFFSGVINLLYLSPAIYMLQIYDRVLTSQNITTLIALSGLLLGLFIFVSLLEATRASTMARIGDAVEAELTPRVYESTFQRQLRAPQAQANQPLWDLNQIRQFFSGTGLSALMDLPWFPIFIVAVFLLHPTVGWFVTLGSILLLVTSVISERIARPGLSQASEMGLAAQGLAASQLRNAEVITALGMLPALANRWKALQIRARTLQRQVSDQVSAMGGISRLMRLTIQSGTLGIGAYLAILGEMTPGAMIAATILSTRALAPLEALIVNWKSMLASLSSQQRLDRLLKEHPEPLKGMSIPRPRGIISAENIFVSAPSNRAFILKGLSFEFEPGEAIGIIGPSASGKSTLLRAILGVWPTALGKMRIDGSEIRGWPREEIGPAIGYLPQDIELFGGTVGENIARFGELNSERIIEATNACGMHGMILRLPSGYDTEIGEGGITLSAGQRQLIGLARAVYGQPVVIALDEPSSNLDEVGDRVLAQTIKAAKSWGSTVIVVSHDPKLLKLMDRLMMIFDGQIREFGPSSEVISAIKRRSTKPVREERVQ